MNNKLICTLSKLIFVLVSVVMYFSVSSQQLKSVNGSIPAYPYPINYTQPDGSNVTITLKGDEYLNWAKTADGYTLVRNNKNGYEYATVDADGNLVPSGILARASKQAPSSISKDLKFSKQQITSAISKRTKSTQSTNAFPSTGNRNFLLILVNFNNTNTTYTQTNFDNYMNQTGYNFQGATGSFKDYYLDNSFNLLNITTTVTAWVTVNNTHDYYGPQANWSQLVYDAIVAAHNADPLLDFSQFDNDGDGHVDGVAIIHQGLGQETTGNVNDVWSHTGNVSSYGLYYNGVSFNSYTMQPEILGSGMTTIGAVCHEFGHNLGLPDLYATDYSSNGMGDWDIMAGGEWLNNGKTPSNNGAWSKDVLNWITPTTISTANTYTLNNASQNQDCYKITTTTNNEYFLLENRQQVGWDIYLPGHGLLVTHIDGSLINSTWGAGSNSVNNNPNHQGVDVVEADNTLTTNNNGDAGDAFPGNSYNTAFTDVTSPNSQSWAGNNTNKPVTNIVENTSTDVVSFCLISCAPGTLAADFYSDNTAIYVGGSVNFTPTSITPSGTTITNYQWTFYGGTPSSYTGATPPAITYSSTGSHTVSLTITNSTGATATKNKSNYIVVSAVPVCNWTTQASAFTTAARGVIYISIADPNTVWGVGLDGSNGNILKEYTKTSDGGASWHAGTMTGVTSGNVPSSIFAMSSTKAYIAAYNTTTPSSGGIFVTSNGGTSWTKQTTATFSGSAAFADFVHFFNANEGVCVGDPNGGYFEIYTTTNGGTNWTRVATSSIAAELSGEAGYCNMYDAAGDTVWFTTNKGRVYRSVDKGFHWTVVAVPGFTDFTDLSFNDANNGLAQHVVYTTQGAITSVAMRATNDGGSTWTTINPGSGIFFTDYDGVPNVAGKFISVGNDGNNGFGSSYSTDYGVTWNNIDIGTQYISTKFYDNITGWAGGFNASSTSEGIYKYFAFTTKIDEVNTVKDEELFIYPNPASGIINIQLYGVAKQNLKIKIYNLMGELVMLQSDFSSINIYNKSINISSLSKGVYIAVIESQNHISKKKIIIE